MVLSRELSLKDIRYISENTDVKLGASCMGPCVSFSGELLVSSLVGGRSGNRANVLSHAESVLLSAALPRTTIISALPICA